MKAIPLGDLCGDLRVLSVKMYLNAEIAEIYTEDAAKSF